MSHESDNSGYQQIQDLQMMYGWILAPFQQIAGIEVLERMRFVVEGHEFNMEDGYITMRNYILRNILPNGRIGIIAPLSSSGIGKGDFNKGMMRCLSNDYLLNNYIDESGKRIAFKVLTMPVSMYAQAAKLPRIHNELPQFAIDPKKQNHEYTEEDLEKISGLMFHDYEKYVILREGHDGVGFTSNDSGIVIFEPGSLTAVPAEITEIKKDRDERDSYGREIVGVDRGQGALYAAIKDLKRRGYGEDVFLFGIEKSVRVNQFADNWRNLLKATDKAVDLKNIFGKDVKVIFTIGEEGFEFDVEYIPQHLQEKIIDFIKKTMVLPPGTKRSRTDFEQMKNFLVDEGLVDSGSDEDYFLAVAEALKLEHYQMFIVRNHYWEGQKTWDMDYFYRNSLPAQVYPELVEELHPIIIELSAKIL